MSARQLLTCLLALVLAACASIEPASRLPAPERPTPDGTNSPVAGEGARIAAAAEQLVGSPYRFGGSGPAGFDCSGLVFFLHRELGLNVPRTAASQFQVATPVTRAALEPGDVVFFRDGGPEVTHVGVFIGDGAFVHAPKSGRPVGYARLEDEYYTVNFAGAGRLHRSR